MENLVEFGWCLVGVTASSVTHLLLIGWVEVSVQLSALFPGIPYGEALPLAENSLLQEVHSQLPNGFPGNKEEEWRIRRS